MIHNDVLRRLRFALQINDEAAISIFKLVDYEMEKDYLHGIMKREEEDGFMPCRDKILGLFLDGLIIKKRGKQEGAEPKALEPGERLSNNEVLRKIRIAMSYKDEDMIQVLKLANFRMSKGELSALFRKPDHRNFKECGDQVVRNLLKGMVTKYRPDAQAKNALNKTNSTSKPPFPKKTQIQSKPAGIDKKTKPSVPPQETTGTTKSVWGKVKPK